MIKKIILLILLLFFSCFNSNKSNKRSNSDFLAYYNTYYMAEKDFNEALEIIKLDQSETDQIPIQAKNLLNSAIENALIIENKFYNSQYLDDAYYILAMSSYMKNKITSSEHYFNRIHNEYPESDYFIESLIMLGNLHLKMNRIDSLDSILEKLENEKKINNHQMYLYYLLLADYSKYNGNNDDIIKNYLLALDNIFNKADQILVYNKLIKLSENNHNYSNAVIYIDKIQNILNEQRISDELFHKWLNYNKILEQYDIIINKLNEYIQNEVITKKYIYYNVELSKIHLLINQYGDAKIILENLVDEYGENPVSKKELVEAYYLLGTIYFNLNWDFEASQETYQNAIDISKSSTHGKKSKENITSMQSYFDLIEEISYERIMLNEELTHKELDDSLMNIPLGSFNKLDSLIFHSAQILYFDLGAKDSAIYKFKQLINNYPDSQYRYKSLVILNIENPDSNWEQILKEEYLNSMYIEGKLTKIDSLRDQAWDLLAISNDESIVNFLSLYTDYNDEKSLYIVGFIYDDYIADFDQAILFYNMYLEKFPEGVYSMKIKDRLLELKDMMDYKIAYLNQKINFRIGKRWFENKFKIDSSIFYIDIASEGTDRDLKSYCKDISGSIKLFRENDSLLNMNYSNLDSVKLNLAHILYKDLSYDLLAADYYKQIIISGSNEVEINESLAALSLIESDGIWDSLLYSNLQDSNLYSITINNAQKKYEYKMSGSMESDSLDLLWLNKKYKKHFPIIEESNLQSE